MRFARVPESLLAAPVSDRAFRVLVGLLLHADREGRCHPTNRRLAQVTGIPPRTIQKGIAELIKGGAVAVDGQTSRRIIVVKLAPDWARALAPEPALAKPQLAPDWARTSAGLGASASAGLDTPLEQTIRTDQEHGENSRPPAPACTHEEPEPELPPLTPEQAKRKALAEKVSKMLGDGGPEHAASIDSIIGTHSEAAVMQVAAQCIGKQSPLLYFFSIVRTTGLDKYELRPGQYRKGTPLPTKPASLAVYTAPAASVDDPPAEHWRTLPEATQARYEAAERTRDKAANKYTVKARAMEAAFRARGRVETCGDGATSTAT
jgi:hypothetical protein